MLLLCASESEVAARLGSVHVADAARASVELHFMPRGPWGPLAPPAAAGRPSVDRRRPLPEAGPLAGPASGPGPGWSGL